MKIVFYRLFNILQSRQIKIKDIREIISNGSITKLQHNDVVTTETICRLCEYLNCTPNDIMEVVPDDYDREKEKVKLEILALEDKIKKLKESQNQN